MIEQEKTMREEVNELFADEKKRNERLEAENHRLRDKLALLWPVESQKLQLEKKERALKEALFFIRNSVSRVDLNSVHSASYAIGRISACLEKLEKIDVEKPETTSDFPLFSERYGYDE